MKAALFIPTAILVLVLAGIGAGAAEVYRWVDDRGRVHYGDRAPGGDRGAKAATVPIRPAPPADPGRDRRTERRDRLLHTLTTEREERRAGAARERAQREALRRKCAAARRQLTEYQRANVLYRKGKDGARDFLSNNEREAAISQLRDGVARNCKQG